MADESNLRVNEDGMLVDEHGNEVTLDLRINAFPFFPYDVPKAVNVPGQGILAHVGTVVASRSS